MNGTDNELAGRTGWQVSASSGLTCFNLGQSNGKGSQMCEMNEGGVGGSVCIGKIVVLVNKNEYLDRLRNEEFLPK